jgi:predicted nucleic acid-binding protein
VLTRLDLVRISNRILDEAAALLPIQIRSLDAIHLATAGQLGQDLGVLVTYDDRMADAAKSIGHRVAAPR